MTGTVTIDAAATLAVSLTGSLSVGQKHIIVVSDDVVPDAVTGTFAGLAQDTVVGNFGGTDLKSATPATLTPVSSAVATTS